jgi:hypothetical protein
MAALSPVAIVSTERKGKRTEITGTQHVVTLKHKFLHYITIKMVFFITKIIFNIFAPLLFGSDIYRQ